MSEEKRVWGIHTMDDNLFLQNNIIAIGWEEFGDLSLLPNDRTAFKEKYLTVYPDAKKGAIAPCAGILYRFVHEVQIGDYIIFPSKIDRKINIGTIEGEYHFELNVRIYNSRRKVKWLKHLPRTSFSQGALYEVGAAQTFFSVKNYADEFLSALDKNFSTQLSTGNTDDETEINITAASIEDGTKDFVLKSLSKNLKGYPLEDLVENLLKAMGYKTTLSAHGGDHGIDIIAFKDELPPRILVQVKSQDGDIKETTIQALRGALDDGDYGLFVTLSNYTPNAQKFLEKTPRIRGINGSDLVDLITAYYEKLDLKYRNLIPLKKVYIPTLPVE